MSEKKVLVSPSILSADFGCLNEDIASIEAFSDSLHVDTMDGTFVPNLSFGAPVVRCVKTKLPLQCHLMVEHPETYVEDFKKAGAETFIFHIEATSRNGSLDAAELIKKIRENNMRVGVSLNPGTELSSLDGVLENSDASKNADYVLVMSVNPGFGGQEFMPVALEKIKKIRARFPDLEIAVDGGINEETGALARAAGANILIAGSYIFKSKNREAAIASLRA